ncbi:SPOR domain-containing protein [Azospirillum sp. B510]|uniref:SPOR domain-containing protein n=1 Tax=Azospirillum sp. (strain B510) TaxID=137722 RepID=UPI00030CCC3E|nr:SPOR domain-containing protein [Azospirillum sp. B510]
MKKLLLAVPVLLLLVVAFSGGYYLAGGGRPGVTAQAGKDGPAPAEAANGNGSAGAPAGGQADVRGGAKAAEAKDASGEAPPADIPVRPAAAAVRGGMVYSIELGAFRSPDNARSFAGVMRQRGLPVVIVEAVDATGRPWLRVRAGSFADLWQAEARRPEYERIAGIGGVVVGETSPATPP